MTYKYILFQGFLDLWENNSFSFIPNTDFCTVCLKVRGYKGHFKLQCSVRFMHRKMGHSLFSINLTSLSKVSSANWVKSYLQSYCSLDLAEENKCQIHPNVLLFPVALSGTCVYFRLWSPLWHGSFAFILCVCVCKSLYEL